MVSVFGEEKPTEEMVGGIEGVGKLCGGIAAEESLRVPVGAVEESLGAWPACVGH